MSNDVFTFLVGGKAGEGVKKAGSVASHLFSSIGRYIFQLDDYMSLIRGGHNFSVVSTSKDWISSHYMKADLMVLFDERSYKLHENELKEDGILVYNSDEVENGKGIGIPLKSEANNYSAKSLMYGVGAVAVLSSVIGLNKEKIKEIIESEYPRGIEDNISYANKIYDLIDSEIGNKYLLEKGDMKRPIITGNEAISMGAIAGGLNSYYGYPMTPASSILHFLANKAKDFGLAVVHAESELAVINMAIGSAFTGAKTMVGTSGGGFALMSEGISLAGITETPILIILSMRPGPATGVPTYTEQGDLNFALNVGHGEFLRIVSSPSSIQEAFYLTSEMLDLVWKFQTPGILLTEKHLSESTMSVNLDLKNVKWAKPIMHQNGEFKRYLDTEDGISPMLFPPSKEVIKWNSYEHDEYGITTENAKMIAKMHEKRSKKIETMKEHMKNMKTVNVYGDTGPIIFTYGSTTMSVLEALKYGNINARVVQPIYLSPFPEWELNDYKNKSVTVVEMSSTGLFATLLEEKARISINRVIKRYDGRPFDPIELSKKLKEVV